MKMTLRKWFFDKNDQWFDDNLSSIVNIDSELNGVFVDDNGHSYCKIGDTEDRFYPTRITDVIMLDNGEEYFLYV